MRKFIVGFFVFLCSMSAISAQELKITSSPNPVAPGKNVRVTIESGFPLESPTVAFLNKNLPLTKVGDRLYTVSFLVPTTMKPGIVQSSLGFNSTSGKGLKVPFQFEVSAPNKGLDSGIESRGVSIKTNPLQEANIKIDQLEDSVKKLQLERQALKKDIDKTEKELANLKRTPRTTSAQLAQKEKELKDLDKQLSNREQTLNTKQAQYQKQLEDLVARETALSNKEEALRKREEQLAKERESVALQLKSVDVTQQELQKKESELSKRQQSVDVQEVALRTQSQNLKNSQTQLDQRTSALAAEKALLAEKEKDLQILRKQLGAEDAGVKAREQELKSQRDALAKKNAEMESLASQIQQQKRLVAESETALKRRLQEVDAVAKKLAEERQFLDDRQSKIKARESDLKVEEAAIAAQIKSLSIKDEELQQIEKTLKEEDQAMKRQQAALTEQSSQLTKKEADLAKIQQDIASQNMSLQRLMQDVQIDRVTLTSQAADIQSEKERLAQKQSALQQERTVLQSQQEKNQALEVSLTRRRQILEKELSNSKSLQEQERQHLESQRQEINTLDLELRASKQKLTAMAADQSQREQAIRQAQSEQDSREMVLSRRLTELEGKEVRIEALRKDVYDKYTALEDLKVWVDERTYALQEAYALAQRDKAVNTAAFQDQFQKLERLTRMLQQRTRSLMEINRNLNQQNEALEVEIQTVVPTASQFTVAPYLGYRSFSDTGIKNGPNIGIKLMGSFSRDWGFDTGLGMVPTLQNDKSQLVYTLDFLFSRHFATVGRFRFFGLVGLGGRIASAANVGFAGGVGIRNPLSEDTSADLDILYGPDFLVRLGLDMKLRFDERASSRARGLNAPQTTVLPGTIDVLLRVPEVRYQTAIRRPTLQDGLSNWFTDNAELSAAFGLLDLTPVIGEKNTYMLFPSKTVTLVEAVKMLTRATYLPKMVADEALPISMTIVDLPGVEYVVKLWIEDELGQHVRTLIEGDLRGVGDFSANWDGLNTAGERIPAGKYVVKVSLLDRVDKRVVVATQSPVSVVDRSSFKWDWSAAKESIFTDISATYPDRPIINSWMALGNTAGVIKTPADTKKLQTFGTFDPAQPMTRISFIISLSRSLEYLGAKSYTIPDLSPYSDVTSLSKEVQDRIGLYISELNYGGDDQRRLRLYDPITRAEAVTLLGRFLQWQSKRFEFPLP
jgi:hypothetical protein